MTLEQLYEKIVSFYSACDTRGRNISDTWVHSIARKGALYTLDEMRRMRRPGSDVTLHINIFDYFGDTTRVDLSNDIVRKLVETGESDFGFPMREVSVAGKSFSSVYLKHLSIAAGIVARLEKRGVTRPTIMEIGGGQGLLLAALRNWYGDKMTAIAVDIPETLFYQSFYLGGTSADAPLAFVPDHSGVATADGGFTFVNAYAAAGHDFRVDALINANSMQEMDAPVANAYLELAERWVRPGGLLEFRNSYGHAIDSVSDPSEYEFGPSFRLIDSDFGDFFSDNSATQFVAYTFEHAGANTPPQDKAGRRLALRALWNGYATGMFAPGDDTARAVEAAAGTGDEAAVSRAFRTIGIADWADALRQRPVDDAPMVRASKVTGDPRWRRLTALWNLQREITHAMRAGVSPMAKAPFREAGAAAGSDHWSAHFACIAAILGDGVTALRLIDDRGAEALAVWRLRFAWIAARAGSPQVAARWIDSVRPEELDPAWRPALAVGLHAVGRREDAAALLDVLLPEIRDIEALRVLHRCNARIGRLESLADVERVYATMARDRFTAAKIGLAATLLSISPDARTFVSPSVAGDSCEPAAIELLSRCGETGEALRRAQKSIEAGWDSYYALGGLVGPLFVANADDMAMACMTRSLALRKDAIRHLEFLSGVCLAHERFAPAAGVLRKIVARKPYDHVACGQLAYAEMADSRRDSGMYGTPKDLPALFQTYQGFYFPDGPRVR